MANALHAAAACARCATPVDGGTASRCPRCGVLLESVAAGSAVALRDGPLLGVAPSAGPRRRAAVAIDVAVALAATAAAVLVTETVAAPLARNVELAVGVGAAALLLTIAVLVAVLRATGRTPGRALLRLRTVDALSALPPRDPAAALGALATGRGRTVVTADLANGRDPLSPRLGALVPDVDQQPTTPTPTPAAPPVPVEAAGARLVLESGDEVVVTGAVLLGRAPESTREVRAVHALPDLSRGIGRTHLLAEWSNGLLWITDLGTPGGTTLRSDAGAFQPLLPQVRAAVAPGWQVRLGGRTLTVRSLMNEEVRGG